MDFRREPQLTDAEFAEDMALASQPGTMDLLTQQQMMKLLAEQHRLICQLQKDEKKAKAAYEVEKAEWQARITRADATKEEAMVLIRNVEKTRKV